MASPDKDRPALLDVNVLIALTWPNHEGHDAARRWFAEDSPRGWVTTPVTETGFVRVSSNRHALATATTPRRANDMLGRLTSLPGHTFWPDSVRQVAHGHVDLARLTGYRQVTDAHLIALCVENNGDLVTFDRAVRHLAAATTAAVRILAGDGPGP